MTLPLSTHERLASTLARLPVATAGIDEEFMRNQTMLAGNMLIDTANALIESQTARRIRDFEFASQDLQAITSELGPDAVTFEKILEELTAITEEMKSRALSANVRTSIETMIERINERLRAAERRNFLPPGTEPEPLPHSPETLAGEAADLRAELRAGEFETPVLDSLVDDPASFELRDYSALADELHGVVQ